MMMNPIKRHRIPSILFLMAAVISFFGATPLLAQSYTIYVGPKDSPAYAYAQSKENDQTVFAERKLTRGLKEAAEILNSTPGVTVQVLVSAGSYTGELTSGIWVLPAITNPEGKLHIMGGFNDEFSARNPFGNLTHLQTAEGRDGAMIQISRRSTLGELVISGFMLDASPSNKYDAKTNSILKGSSRTYPMISFSQLRVDHLVVADNVFINGAHGAFDPYIMPASANTVVDIQNNFFLNTIKTLKPAATSSRGNVVAEINLRHNTSLLNWPFNPDPTSSNVSAIELYHTDGCKQLNIEGNIFAFNPGGAMQHDWPMDRMPDISIANNLFFMNGALFGEGNPEDGVIAGKFGHNPKYLVFDIETAEDELDYDVDDNVSIDPGISIALSPLQAADSYSVEAQKTVLNDIRGLFGLNKDGGTVAIANYAPRMAFSPDALPLPTNADAKPYGVQPTKTWK